MPGIFFTTNDSEFSRLEGLYVKERNPPAVISGVFLGVTGVTGEAIRGPVDRAVEITSEARFREIYGWRDQGSGGVDVSPLWKAIVNKPFGKLVIVRAAADGAVAATKNFANVTPTDIIQVDATSVGAWGNNVEVSIENATDGDSTHFNLRATYLGRDYLYKNLNTDSTNDNLAEVIGSDDSNVIVVTKLANGRPLNGGPTALLTGSDGSIADSDFTGSGRAMEVLNGRKDIGIFFVAERSSDAIKTKIATLAEDATGRLFLMCPNDETDEPSDAATDAASYRSDRIIYCFNHPYTLDPETAAEMLVQPTSWMASILSQTDVDIHPGEEDTKKLLAGITRLYNETYQREDYITLREGGVCGLERDSGFDFVSGRTTSLEPGREEITRRRMTDYLQLSMANTLKHSVKKKNTNSRKKANAGMVESFLEDLKLAERIVLDFEVDPDKLNTPSQEAQGIVKLLVRVRLIGHVLSLVLETEIGQAVIIKEAA